MIYKMTRVHEGTHYKAKFHEASVYKLSSVSLQICLFFFSLLFLSFLFFFCTEYHFALIIWIDRPVQRVSVQIRCCRIQSRKLFIQACLRNMYM